MNKPLIALLSAFTVFAANAAMPTAPAAQPGEMSAPAAKSDETAAPMTQTAAAPKAEHVKKEKHAAQKKVLKHEQAKASKMKKEVTPKA